MGLNRLTRFDREFFDSGSLMTYIDDEEFGGKATCLVSIGESIEHDYDPNTALRIEAGQEELSEQDVLAASEHVLGNGISQSMRDIVHVNSGSFDAARTRPMPMSQGF